MAGLSDFDSDEDTTELATMIAEFRKHLRTAGIDNMDAVIEHFLNRSDADEIAKCFVELNR